MDHAEAFTVSGISMVKSAADVYRGSVTHRQFSGQDGTACCQPEGVHQFFGVGKFEQRLFLRRDSTGAQLAHPIVVMGQADIVVACRLWSNKVFRDSDAGLQQPLLDHPVFFRRKYMAADRKVISVTVNQFEGKHGQAKRLNATTSCGSCVGKKQERDSRSCNTKFGLNKLGAIS